ncbi:MAG: rhamnogalacturonan acetylesterase [Telluria sp.]
MPTQQPTPSRATAGTLPLLLSILLAPGASTAQPILLEPGAPRLVLTLAPDAKARQGELRLAPGTAYDAARGVGYTNTRDGNEQAVAVKAVPGDYRVRATLGSANAASRTTLWAEDRRLMAGPVDLTPGETKTVEFIVNVRDPAIAASEQDAAGRAPRVGLRGDDEHGRSWDERLTVAVSGARSALQALEIEPVKARRILIAGDSTVTDQAGADYASWGQMLPRFLSNEVAVANHARSGETMKSFVTSLRWDKLLADLRPFDIVLLQFGHNDQKSGWPRTYVDPIQAYPAWLRALASDVLARGAKVVLVSPVSRRAFNREGKFDNTLAGYDDAVRRLAQELKLPFIDLTAKTRQLYEALGPAASAQAFAKGGQDTTHHNAYGAYQIANYVAQALVAPEHGLALGAAPDFKAFDPARPADPARWALAPADWPLMRETAGKVSGD